jgi:hypothetical protein
MLVLFAHPAFDRTLLADLTEKKETDAGWDSESLREDVLSRPMG